MFLSAAERARLELLRSPVNSGDIVTHFMDLHFNLVGFILLALSLLSNLNLHMPMRFGGLVALVVDLAVASALPESCGSHQPLHTLLKPSFLPFHILNLNSLTILTPVQLQSRQPIHTLPNPSFLLFLTVYLNPLMLLTPMQQLAPLEMTATKGAVKISLWRITALPSLAPQPSRRPWRRAAIPL